MTPFTAPVKIAKKGLDTVTKPIGKALAPVGKALAPVGDVVGKIADPVAKISGTVATAAGVAGMFFPPLEAVAAGAEAVSIGASLAGSASKMIDCDPDSKVGMSDVMGALPMTGLFP